jgi:hypothetical protein
MIWPYSLLPHPSAEIWGHRDPLIILTAVLTRLFESAATESSTMGEWNKQMRRFCFTLHQMQNAANVTKKSPCIVQSVDLNALDFCVDSMKSFSHISEQVQCLSLCVRCCVAAEYYFNFASYFIFMLLWLRDIFFLLSWGGARLRPLGTSVTVWPIVTAPDDTEV